MKQFIKFLILMALFMSQKDNVYAYASKTQVCMTYVCGDIYTGTVGPRRAPMYVGCPLSVYVDNEQRCMVLQSAISNYTIAYEIIQGGGQSIVYGEVNVNNDETYIYLDNINNGKHQFKVQIGECSFIGWFELSSEDI